MSLIVLVFPLPPRPSHPGLSPARRWRGRWGLRARERSGQHGRGRSSSLAGAAGTPRSRRWGDSGPSGAQGPVW